MSMAVVRRISRLALKEREPIASDQMRLVRSHSP